MTSDIARGMIPTRNNLMNQIAAQQKIIAEQAARITELETPNWYWTGDDSDPMGDNIRDLIYSYDEFGNGNDEDVIESACSHYLPDVYIAIWFEISDGQRSRKFKVFDNNADADRFLAQRESGES